MFVGEMKTKDEARGIFLDTINDEEVPFTPFNKGGYMLMDKDEIVEFNDDGGWELLDDDFDLSQTS